MKERSIEKQKELRHFRFLALFAIVMYPLFGYINTFVLVPQYESVDFFYQRLTWGFLVFLMFVASYFFKRIRDYFVPLCIFFTWVMTIHILYLGKVNGFTFHHAIGVVLVIMGSSFIMSSFRLLNFYLIFTMIISILAIRFAKVSEIPPINLMLIYFIVCAWIASILGVKFKLEQTLKRNHANISALINNTNDIIWSIDTDFKYIAFNKSFEQITFLLTGKNPVVGELTLVENTSEEIGQKLKSIYMAGLFGNSMSVEQAINLNGKINYMSVSSRPIRLPNGKIIGVTIFGHNVTEAKLAEQKINHQKQLIIEKHKEITDSINYSERIQRALLASKQLLDENLKDYFVLFKPKDVVSGDFYWASKFANGNFVLVTADSTGHGIPGAIMSILNIACLKEAVIQGIQRPDLILNETRRLVIESLMNDGSREGGKDGMDASAITFDFKKKVLSCACALNPVWIIKGTEFIEIEADRIPIGKHENDKTPFTLRTVELQKGDLVYTFTDGYADQFGGPKLKKFMYKKLKELLLQHSQQSMAQQQSLLESEFNKWKGDLEQVDDVCLIGVRI